MRGCRGSAMKNDAPLRLLAASVDHDADRFRRRLLDDAILRQRYISPLIKMWCEEVIHELSK